MTTGQFQIVGWDFYEILHPPPVRFEDTDR